MGACDDSLVVNSTNKKKVLSEFKKYQKEAAYESGNSYSGRLNMCPGLTFLNQKFGSRNAAAEYLLDCVQKWENALAVQFKDSDGKLKTFILGMCSS